MNGVKCSLLWAKTTRRNVSISVIFRARSRGSHKCIKRAHVKIVAGGITQTDEVRSGGSYISQSDFRLHFGLGSAVKIESQEVRWPSGKVETFKNLAADRGFRRSV